MAIPFSSSSRKTIIQTFQMLACICRSQNPIPRHIREASTELIPPNVSTVFLVIIRYHLFDLSTTIHPIQNGPNNTPDNPALYSLLSSLARRIL